MKILGKEDWLTRGQSLAEHGDHGAVQYPYGPVVDSVRTALGRASLAVRVVRANNRARQRHQATLWKRSIRHGIPARVGSLDQHVVNNGARHRIDSPKSQR